MKSIGQRMDEFVKYHIEGDGECNNVVLNVFSDRHCNTLQDKYELAYFFAITYSVVSAALLYEERDKIFADTNSWAADNKRFLVFQSDRKYIRMKDSFERVLMNFHRDVNVFMEKVMEGGKIILEKAIPYVSEWVLFGRFSAFLFLETFATITEIPYENTTIEWKKGNTATSGLLNLFGYDKEANIFDKTGKLLLTEKQMDAMLEKTISEIEHKGGSGNVTEIETSLCAYRKFYKGSRYNGYYLDRMLEEIYTMEKTAPALSHEFLDIREEMFNKKYLGEFGGWRGIRKGMKKLYMESGMIA